MIFRSRDLRDEDEEERNDEGKEEIQLKEYSPETFSNEYWYEHESIHIDAFTFAQYRS